MIPSHWSMFFARSRRGTRRPDSSQQKARGGSARRSERSRRASCPTPLGRTRGGWQRSASASRRSGGSSRKSVRSGSESGLRENALLRSRTGSRPMRKASRRPGGDRRRRDQGSCPRWEQVCPGRATERGSANARPVKPRPRILDRDTTVHSPIHVHHFHSLKDSLLNRTFISVHRRVGAHGSLFLIPNPHQAAQDHPASPLAAIVDPPVLRRCTRHHRPLRRQ